MPATLATPARASRRTLRTHRHPAMAVLLARYVAGQIAEAEWGALSATLDAADVSPSERAAFAAFCADAAADGAPELPQPGEFEAVLALTRA